ncbi:MAG: hypothetical protein QOF57_2567 [Frankiaceae bacterium]|nr:hypothetical protein [Frankiaceae bacterium]
MTHNRPGVLAWLRYTYGGRMPLAHLEWARRDLTEPGWRERVVLRVLVQVSPFVAAGTLVPGPPAVHVAVPALMVLTTLLIVAPFSEEIRDARLRHNGLPVPPRDDRDGPPPPESWPGMRR